MEANEGNAEATATQTVPEDRLAYRLAVGALGAALVAFLIGAAVIAAGGKPVPTQYWSTGSAIAGALLGILAPTPQRVPKSSAPPTASRGEKIRKGLAKLAAPIQELWNNRALLILLVLFGVSIGFSVANNSSELESVAAAAAGALIGLLAPPPTSNSAASTDQGAPPAG